MKITAVEPIHLRVPVVEAIPDGTLDVLVVLVHTDEEIASLLAEPGQYIAAAVVDVGSLYRAVRERLEEIRRDRKAKAAAKKKQSAGKVSAKRTSRAACWKMNRARACAWTLRLK